MPSFKHSFDQLNQNQFDGPQETPNKCRFLKILGFLFAGFILLLVIAVIIYETMRSCPNAIETMKPEPPSKGNQKKIIYRYEEEYVPPTGLAAIEDVKCKKRVIGHINMNNTEELNTSQYSKLTHIIFEGFERSLDGQLKILNSSRNSTFEKMKATGKLFKVKMLVSMGIEGERELEDFEKRKLLISSYTLLIQKHELDGIDIEWKFTLAKTDEHMVMNLSKDMREELTRLQEVTNRTYIISMTLQKERSGVDFQKILEFVNFLNINTDQYYSQSGHLVSVGPPAPLFSGTENVDSTLKYYSCLTQSPHRLNMKVSFGGNVFRSVINGEGIFGEYVRYGEMTELGWNDSISEFNPETNTMFIRNSNDYFAYDGLKGLSQKIKYAVDKNIGGFTSTEIDGGEEEETFLKTIANNPMCFLTDNLQFVCK